MLAIVSPLPKTCSAWDRTIPADAKSAWRDPAVASAYVAAALASDPTSKLRTPPSIRVPNGPLEDSFYLAQGRQFWDASLIYSPTLILRSQLDFWSRPEDVTRLKQQLLHAPRVRAIEIPNGTHYVLLERAEKGRKQLLEEILSFLENKSHGEAIATPDTSTMVR
jgi:pimeloyl-ACP methyl ester carboxylesterase